MRVTSDELDTNAERALADVLDFYFVFDPDKPALVVLVHTVDAHVPGEVRCGKVSNESGRKHLCGGSGRCQRDKSGRYDDSHGG